MIVIIDGYNVLKMTHPALQVSERERTAFITSLARYGAITQHTILLVFDGGNSMWPETELYKTVSVVYSGYRSSADYVIKDLLERHSKKEVVLITTDRELNKYAEQFAIPSIESIDFYRFMHDRLTAVPDKREHKNIAPVQKRSGHVSSKELDAMMVEGCQKVLHKDENGASEQRPVHARKESSKVDKRLERIVKKL